MENKLIPRETVVATLTLSNGRNIAGEIQIDLDTRLSDFMNRPERFIVICDKNQMLKSINKDHIIEISLQ